MSRYVFPLLLGVVGVAILCSPGTCQLHRLTWKEAMLADIETRIAAPPVDLATVTAPDAERDQYLPVTVKGRTTGEEADVLSGLKEQGTGFEIISAFETSDGRRILLDRGFVPEAQKDVARPPVELTVTGNLEWPNEADTYTPEPDLSANLWFARNVPDMAASLKTDPILVVIRTADGDAQGILPMPVDTTGIPNDHLNYAITWFSLAAVWAGMTLYLLWRIRQRTA